MKPFNTMSIKQKAEVLYILFPQHVPLLVERLHSRVKWALANQDELCYQMGRKASRDILKACRLLNFRIAEFAFLVRNFRFCFSRLLFDKKTAFLSAMLIDRIADQFTYEYEFVHIVKALFNSPNIS